MTGLRRLFTYLDRKQTIDASLSAIPAFAQASAAVPNLPRFVNSLGEHFELMAWWRIAYAVAPVYGSLNAIASSVITR